MHNFLLVAPELEIYFNMSVAIYNGKIANYNQKVATYKVVRILDYDGNIYTPITIGTQTWLSENLKTTHYNNGDAIESPPNPNDWNTGTSGKYQWANLDINNKTSYGAMYNWYVTQDVRGVCPAGYHIPSNAEFSTLIAYLGGSSVAGGKMKETGTAHWNDTNNASNSSGFTAMGAGWITDGYTGLFRDYALFWPSDYVADPLYASRLYLSNTSLASTQNAGGSKLQGYSIRCIRD